LAFAAGAAIAGEFLGARHLQEAFLEQVVKSENEPKGGGFLAPRTPPTPRTRRGKSGEQIQKWGSLYLFYYLNTPCYFINFCISFSLQGSKPCSLFVYLWGPMMGEWLGLWVSGQWIASTPARVLVEDELILTRWYWKVFSFTSDFFSYFFLKWKCETLKHLSLSLSLWILWEILLQTSRSLLSEGPRWLC
jgi:hypothetical protein